MVNQNKNNSLQKLSIIGATFIGNRGAEAMLTTVIAKIRRLNPKVEFNVFSYYPKYDRFLVRKRFIKVFSATPFYLSIVLFPLSLFFALFKALRLNFLLVYFPNSIISLATSKALLDIPGVSFSDGRMKYLPYNILTILPAMILGIPVIKLAQALGPFNNPINRLAAKTILSRCSRVYARGLRSFNHLRKLGLQESHYRLSSDVAFLRDNCQSLTVENEDYFKPILSRLIKIKGSKKIIGICPSSLVFVLCNKNKVNYLEVLKESILTLNNLGYLIIVFPNASLPDNSFKNNDLTVIELLRSSFKEDKKSQDSVIFINRCINTDKIRDIIKICEITIVSRFHAMIASLSLGVPVITIGWGHKYIEIMEDFGQDNLSIDFKQIEVNKITSMALLTLKKKKVISSEIRSRLNQIRGLAGEQIGGIIEYL